MLLLEHHTVPGGYAHEFRRGHYRFEVSLHAVDGVSPGGWAYTILQGPGILDAIKFHRLDPFYAIRFPDEKLGTAYILPWVSFHLFGGFYPEGGSMAISRALETIIKQHGGEIKYRQTVTRIELKDGKAAAVETEIGLRAEAEIIISNAKSPDTLLKFVGRENLPPDYVK